MGDPIRVGPGRGVSSDPGRGQCVQVRSGGPYYLLDPRPSEVRARDVAWALAHVPRFAGHTLRPYPVLEHLLRCSQMCLLERWGAGWRGRLEDLAVIGARGGGAPGWALADAHLALQVHTHDAQEAYTGDCTRPLKLALGEVWRAVEDLNQEAEWAALCGGAPHVPHTSVFLLGLPSKRGLPLPERLAADPGRALTAGEHVLREVKRYDDLCLSAERAAVMPAGGVEYSGLPEVPPHLLPDFALPPWAGDRLSRADEGEVAEADAAVLSAGRALEAALRARAEYPVPRPPLNAPLGHQVEGCDPVATEGGPAPLPDEAWRAQLAYFLAVQEAHLCRLRLAWLRRLRLLRAACGLPGLSLVEE